MVGRREQQNMTRRRKNGGKGKLVPAEQEGRDDFELGNEKNRVGAKFLPVERQNVPKI